MEETVVELAHLPGVNTATVVHRDGTLATAARQDPFNATLASLSSAIFGAVAEALGKGGIGPLESCWLEAGNQSIYMQRAGDRVVVVVADKGANSGRVKLALRRAAARLVP